MDPFKNKWVTVSLCAYEITAVLSQKDSIPTVTRIVSRHPWVGVVLTTAMAWHFRMEASR